MGLTTAYETGAAYFQYSLAQGVGMIAALFILSRLLYAFSDFKSNEYRNLLGGSYLSRFEENPMLGLRGASLVFSCIV